MGKKTVFGCLGIIVLLMVVTGFLLYAFLIRPALTAFSTLEEIHQANERIENREPYDPPPTGEMEEEQVARFVSVQRRISEQLQEKIEELQVQYEEISQTWEEREPSIREMVTAWGDVLQLYADAKNIQVEALNEEGFSLQEYQFVQQAFYQALGVELLGYNLDSIAEAAKQRDLAMDLDEFKTEPKEFSEEALEKNRKLVSEYSENAEEWLLFSWWGL